jgi:maleate isomerase
MAFSSWRGTVGIIKPTLRPGGLEELIRMLPEGIGVVPLSNNIRKGTRDEFTAVMAGYEDMTRQLAEAGVDLINPSGAPPFMVLGFKGEQELIASWEKKYGKPIFTSGMTHVDALKALEAKRFVGATYFRGEINKTYAKYFADAGFECLDMAGMDVDFDKAQELSSHSVYRFVKQAFLANRSAQAIYMLGPGWRTIDIIEPLEQDLGVPVIQAVAAQCWDIQRRLHVRQPVKGYGRLVAELP